MVLALSALLSTSRAWADDAPVEKPAVDRPALPAGAPEPAIATNPATARPAPAQPARAARSASYAQASPQSFSSHRGFLYLAAGPALITGLSGGRDFERTNPALGGVVGVELPLNESLGLGVELNADLELASSADRGAYAAALLRLRLAKLLAPNTRLWGAVGLGRAGYQIGSLAGSASVGAAYLFVPKFGLDVSANLNLVGAASDARYSNGINYSYDGGVVLVLAVRALFELHH
jgi:hypothetical protein